VSEESKYNQCMQGQERPNAITPTSRQWGEILRKDYVQTISFNASSKLSIYYQKSKIPSPLERRTIQEMKLICV
jgi:hypothetical protein